MKLATTTGCGSRELRETLEILLRRTDLSAQGAERMLFALANPAGSSTLKAAVLAALRSKGESPGELAGLARAMLALARGPVPFEGDVLVDTCGTGGDGSNSFNLSTAAALLVAALGVPVAKHGNRSVSSLCGSADLLEELGVGFAAGPEEAGRALATDGFAFLFAPAFHPAAAAIASVRRELKIRTVFNVLGPLVNPARPTHQLVGAGDLAMARSMAAALHELDVERAFVVHGAGGWDEATPVGAFQVLDVTATGVHERTYEPAAFGVETCSPDALVGAGPAENALLLHEVFAGRPGPLRDAVLLNAALVLLLTRRASEPRAAAELAATALDDGRATAQLARLRRSA